MQHFKYESIGRLKNIVITNIRDKKKRLKNSSKRNNVDLEYARTSNEDINDSENFNS